MTLQTHPSLNQALQLHNMGLAAIYQKGKQAFQPGWNKERNSPEKLQSEFKPGLNVAIVTGELSRSDKGCLIVIDCDVRSDDPKHKAEAWHALLALFGKIRPTTLTGGGGAHWWFWIPHDRLPKMNKLILAEGPMIQDGGKVRPAWTIEALLSGHACTVPPSIHPSGKSYEWANGGPHIEDAPASLIEAIEIAQQSNNAPAAGADAIRRCIEAAAKPAAQPANETNNSKPEPEYMATVRRLAAMPTFEYEAVRIAEAERLNVRISVLDDEVKKLRPREAVPGGALQGKALRFEDPKPWPEPVEGAALLAELARTFCRFLVLPKHADTVLALWVAFTWFFDRAECAPILAFSSPEPRCGKSHALDVLNRLVRRPLPAANISAAVLFRVIDSSNPTLLLDESDTYNLAENDDLRGIINAGHTKANAFVYRIEGEDREPRGFNVFAPKVFASIGKLVQTVIDRSIEIHMKRKTKRERIERLRHARKAEFERLRQMLARFADDNGQAFTASRPTIPDELSDRQADSWEHLLAIADLAGGDWPKLAREAAKHLSAGGGADAESLGVILLKDVYEVFRPTLESGKPDLDRILGCELTAALIKLEERPWAEYRHGKPISQQQLARRLSNFGVVSNTIRTGAERAKGYKFEQFADAFARYLTIPPFQSVTSGQPNIGADFEGISNRDKDVDVTTSKAGQPNTGAGCHGGTVSKGVDGGWEIKGDESEAGSVVVI